MLITILLSFILAFNPAFTTQKPADSKPNFTGTWNARILRPDNAPVSALRVSYRDPKLEIVRMRKSQQPTIVMGRSLGTRSSVRFVYYTDGRGETQTSIPTISGESMKSKTQRIEDKFVITASDHTITFEVAADGKSLTETVTMLSGGNNALRIVHLYDRSAGNDTQDINGEWVERVGDRIISLTVEHRDPEIKITRREISEAQDETEVFIYYTDGRGETNTQVGRAVKSVTKWKGQTLVFALSTKSTIGGETFQFGQTIKWQIGKDGESLVEVSESRMSASGGAVIPPPSSTLVYARSSKPLPD